MKPMFAHRKITELPFAIVIAAVALAMWLLLRIVLWMQVGPSQMLVGQSASAFCVASGLILPRWLIWPHRSGFLQR